MNVTVLNYDGTPAGAPTEAARRHYAAALRAIGIQWIPDELDDTENPQKALNELKADGAESAA